MRPDLRPLGAVEALTALGEVVQIRAATADDAVGLRALNARTDDANLYLRYFATSRATADHDVERHVRPADDDHVALIALVGGEVVGVGSYERVAPDEAEVALLVDDRRHGQGIGTLLLEHLTSEARRHGISTLLAQTLMINTGMLGVFRSSGLDRGHRSRAGVVDVRLTTELDELALDAMDDRERVADTRSLAALLAPRSVAVVGPPGPAGDAAREVVANLARAGFRGPVHVVGCGEQASLSTHTSMESFREQVDLAVVAVPVEEVVAVVAACARRGVRVVVVTTVYPASAAEARHELLRVVRGSGMRVLGPGSLGVVSTAHDVRLDASVGRGAVVRGALALGVQSSSAGLRALARATATGHGVAAFVSLGDKIDISGNDLLLLWDRDPRVDVVALSLSSIGNPHKLARLAWRTCRRKPVVLHLDGPADEHGASEGSVDELCAQSGITRVGSVDELVDVAGALLALAGPAGRASGGAPRGAGHQPWSPTPAGGPDPDLRRLRP